jgi:hypothetical protein
MIKQHGVRRKLEGVIAGNLRRLAPCGLDVDDAAFGVQDMMIPRTFTPAISPATGTSTAAGFDR